MAAAPPNPNMLRIRRRFQLYRGDPVQNNAQIIFDLMNTNYVNPAAAPAGAPPVNALPARPRPLPPQAPAAAAQLTINNFLALDANTIPIPNNPRFGGGLAVNAAAWTANVSCFSLSFLRRDR